MVQSPLLSSVPLNLSLCVYVSHHHFLFISFYYSTSFPKLKTQNIYLVLIIYNHLIHLSYMFSFTVHPLFTQTPLYCISLDSSLHSLFIDTTLTDFHPLQASISSFNYLKQLFQFINLFTINQLSFNFIQIQLSKFLRHFAITTRIPRTSINKDYCSVLSFLTICITLRLFICFKGYEPK